LGGHDLDLSVSRDFIGHVTIRHLMGHFLFAAQMVKESVLAVA